MLYSVDITVHVTSAGLSPSLNMMLNKLLSWPEIIFLLCRNCLCHNLFHMLSDLFLRQAIRNSVLCKGHTIQAYPTGRLVGLARRAVWCARVELEPSGWPVSNTCLPSLTSPLSLQMTDR